MVPPGGSATLYGVLYQLLGSLHHAVRLRLQRRGPIILGARIVVEPSRGGDLRLELDGQRVVEQWKARTTGKPWSLQAIVGHVLPDLYLDSALEDPNDETQYVFATEGYLADSARTFFERLRGPLLEQDPLTGLRQEDRRVLRGMAKSVRGRKQFRSEPESISYPKLRRLLSRFKIREGLNAEGLTQDIDRWLLPLVDYREDRVAKRERLCTMILSKAAHGEVVIVPEDLLKEAGLHGVSLENVDELRRRARKVVEREVERRNYDRDLDVRTMPSWPEDKPFLVLAGESGQGKTWQLARLALELAKDDGNRILAAFLVSQGDVARDLKQAADLLWKQAWDHDQSKSLDRVAAHWREVRGDTGQAWLAVCVDGVQSLSDARILIDFFDWERWGIRLAISVPREIGIKLARERKEEAHLYLLRDFTLPELRVYLRHHGRILEDLPSDVRETLRRPLLAGIYTTIGSDPEWRPTREYQLYEEYWHWLKTAKNQEEYPEDLVRVKRLALSLLNEEPYPWEWVQLERAGLTDEPRRRLEQAGWWVRTDKGMEVWHDRLLSWALAEAVAECGLADEVASYLRRDRRSAHSRISRILGYLPMDVLWLLSGDLVRSPFIPDLLVSMEENDKPFGYLYQARLLPTLGSRIVPGLVERLRRLPDRARYSYRSRAVEVLSRILDCEPDGRAELASLLTDPSTIVRKVAVKVLARHPHTAAIGPLWNLLSEKSMEMETSQGRQGISDRQSAFTALRACLELNPSWLRSKIQGSRPEEEPVWELAYLLANIKHPEARSIWMELKKDLFEKVSPGKLHSLMVCIRVFRDCEETRRLEAWLPLEEKWTDNIAFNGIAWTDPDRAVLLLETVPLKILLASGCAWLSILLLTRADDTRRALQKRMAGAGEDFWRVAHLYWWYAEQMDQGTLETLLDRLAVDVAACSQAAEGGLSSLRRSLDLLSRIHRADLLESFHARAGSDLDRNLGEVGAASISSRSDLQDLKAVILKIGGEGLRRLIRAGLASSDSDRHREAMAWALTLPEELGAIDTDEEWVLAASGEDRVLVERIMAAESELESDDLMMLWQLRRWKPPIGDADLALALDALESTEPQRRARGLAVVSISGRDDLLSQLPNWFILPANLGQERSQALDDQAAQLVQRLAREKPESVRRLASDLDIRRFPWTAARLLHETESTELATRLESDLLESLTTRGRLREAEMEVALLLFHIGRPSDPLLRAVWESGKDSSTMWNNQYFFPAVSAIDVVEVREKIWKEAFESPYSGPRTYAIRALYTMEPDEALRAVRKGLEDPETSEREAFVSLLLELGGTEAIPWLIEQAIRESKTEVLWKIARTLRRATPEARTELRMRLDSPDSRIRSVSVYLSGWLGAGFLESDLRHMAEEDPDDDVQSECLQALARQKRERCILELMNAFPRVEGTVRWSYCESILELGDPYLLVRKEDRLCLDRILTREMGFLRVHAHFRLQERFEEVRSAAEQRDRRNTD